jgi:glutamyl/glutaminyl-tRNA synthetase
MNATPKPKLRFAPSPTGHFHLGHVVSMAFVFGVAETRGMDVHLRIEDHDKERCREDYIQSMLFDMEWLGFLPANWNAIKTQGKEATYRQSFRLERYEEALKKLQARHQVYHCACSRQEITSRCTKQQTLELYYDGHCRKKNLQSGPLRLAFPQKSTSFVDIWQGPCEQIPAEQCGDLLLMDRQGNYTYNFAVVVDDITEAIPLIVRGEDLLACTGRQLLLAEALGYNYSPTFLHHPLILDEKGQKLSKRFLSTSLEPLRKQGMTPHQVLSLSLQQAKLIPENSTITREGVAEWIEKLLLRKKNDP